MADTKKNLYEGMFLVDSAVASASWDDVVATIQQVLDRAEAEVVSLKKWDERRLAFDVKGRKRGTYILTYFKAPGNGIARLERDVQLNELLLRVLVLRADRIPEDIINAPTPLESGIRHEHDSSHDEDHDDHPRSRRPRAHASARSRHDEFASNEASVANRSDENDQDQETDL